jgi:hypothetical protein
MATKFIFAALAVLFLALAAIRLITAGHAYAQVRTWLLLGVIFGAVSAFLFYRS